MNDQIIIRGARENNLKNVNLTIPRDKLVVFTGLSGSGKSSLAFDTIYAEGQRRYVHFQRESHGVLGAIACGLRCCLEVVFQTRLHVETDVVDAEHSAQREIY